MAGCGVLTGMFVIFSSTKSLDYKLSFTISGGFCFLIALFLLFSIKDRNVVKKEEQDLTLK